MLKVQNAVCGGLTGVSCTNEQCQWNSATQPNLSPKRLSEICGKRHKPSSQPAFSIQPVYYSHNIFKKSLEGANVPVGSHLHKCIKAKPNSPHVPAAATQLQLPHGEHGINMQCQKRLSFYDVDVKLEECKCASL